MITLNLIPQEQKTALKSARLYTAFKEAVTLFFLFAAIGSIMLWVSRYYLEQELTDLITINAVNIKSNEATNQRITAINSKISATENIQKNFLPFGQLTAELALLVPENIALNSISFYRQQATVEMIGLAKTRNDLLGFRQELEKTPWISQVDLPLTALIDKDNNNFTIKLTVDPAKLPRL
jgi:Tfp pilus assembly protein PilN